MGSVYFLLDRQTGLVKIGFTTTLKKRLSELDNDRLSLLGFIPGTTSDHEEGFHRQFAHLRVKSEWFKHQGELLDFLARVFRVKGNVQLVELRTYKNDGLEDIDWMVRQLWYKVRFFNGQEKRPACLTLIVKTGRPSLNDALMAAIKERRPVAAKLLEAIERADYPVVVESEDSNG